MATYVIGDIHGDLRRWNEMKEFIQPKKDDKIIIIGDVIDRGEYGVEILQDIMKMDNARLILGNHELMMLQNWEIQNVESKEADEIRDNWMYNGGYPTVTALAALPETEQEEIITYLKTKTMLKGKLTTEDGRTFYICHGFVNGPDDERIHDVVWSRPERCSNPNLDGMLIIGHTPVDNLITKFERGEAINSHHKILHAPYYINIDCGCGHRGSYTCLAALRLEDMAEIYIQ